MPEEKSDKIIKRYGKLDDLIELASHGAAVIKWADKKIVLIEKIDISETKIKE